MRILSTLVTAILLGMISVYMATSSVDSVPTNPVVVASVPGKTEAREFYELRVYKIFDFEKQQLAEQYIENALLPALDRLGLSRVGVFTNLDDENDHSIYMLIPFTYIEQFVGLSDALFADERYRAAAKPYFDRPLKNPVFARIESRLMRAFQGMPVIELPEATKSGQPRIFELRLYESHTEEHARRKVEMFDEGEIQLMRDVKMGPVFFGETLTGPDVPNLIYMLSASDRESHKEHWQAFLAHPKWDRMKNLEPYKDTVSKIKNWFLRPTSYSQL